MKITQLLLTGTLLAATTAGAAEGLLMEAGKIGSSAGNNVVYIRQLEDVQVESRSALGLRGGLSSIQKLEFGNGLSRFAYANSPAVTIDFHWETTPLSLLGHWGLYGGFGYSTYTATLLDKKSSMVRDADVSLLPASAGIVYLGDSHAYARWLTPAFSAGADYTFYLQRGNDGGDALNARGGIWTLRASMGLRHSLTWLGLRSTQLSGDYVLISNFLGTSSTIDSKSVLVGLISNI